MTQFFVSLLTVMIIPLANAFVGLGGPAIILVDCDSKTPSQKIKCVSDGTERIPQAKISLSNLEVLQAQIKRNPELDWLALLDSDGEAIKALLNRKIGLQWSAKEQERLRFFLQAKYKLSSPQRAEKTDLLILGIRKLIEKGNETTLEVDSTSSRTKDFFDAYQAAHSAPSSGGGTGPAPPPTAGTP